jgi:hypothetical protein
MLRLITSRVAIDLDMVIRMDRFIWCDIEQLRITQHSHGGELAQINVDWDDVKPWVKQYYFEIE